MLGTPHRASRVRILESGTNFSAGRGEQIYAGSKGVMPYPEPAMGFGQAPGGTAPFSSHTKRTKNSSVQLRPWNNSSRYQATLRPDLHTNAAYN